MTTQPTAPSASQPVDHGPAGVGRTLTPADGEQAVYAVDLSGRHVGLLVRNDRNAQSWDEKTGATRDPVTRAVTPVIPVWVEIRMVTHKANGDVSVRTTVGSDWLVRSGYVFTVKAAEQKSGERA
jgi:hypothetical protein